MAAAVPRALAAGRGWSPPSGAWPRDPHTRGWGRLGRNVDFGVSGLIEGHKLGMGRRALGQMQRSFLRWRSEGGAGGNVQVSFRKKFRVHWPGGQPGPLVLWG